ncbi:MAG: hypothetical protein LBT09_06520 [Planctomycetaceae bacterium]|nr:hypothetical protein [Planctomycetaceae bacterium]
MKFIGDPFVGADATFRRKVAHLQMIFLETWVICVRFFDFSGRVILIMPYFVVLTFFPFRAIITNNDKATSTLYSDVSVLCVALGVCFNVLW